MAYSTPAMVRQVAAPDLSDPKVAATDTNTVADLGDNTLLAQIAEADSTIDAYLGGRYVTPVAPLDPNADPLVYPSSVSVWSRDIALYLATLTYLRRLKMDVTTDPVALRYRDVMAMLTAVRDGKNSLPLPPNDGDTSGGGAGDPLNPYDGTLFPSTDFDLYGGTHPHLYPSARSYW